MNHKHEQKLSFVSETCSDLIRSLNEIHSESVLEFYLKHQHIFPALKGSSIFQIVIMSRTFYGDDGAERQRVPS